MVNRNTRGFSLLEIAIVVTIIGILASLAIPAFAQLTKRSRFSTLANDLRQYSGAMQTFAMENGQYPDTHSAHGVFVPGMEDLLSTSWLEKSPVGGRYEWVYTTQPDPVERDAYVQIVETGANPFNMTLSDIVELDEDIDDGNIATGFLQVAGARIRHFSQLSAP